MYSHHILHAVTCSLHMHVTTDEILFILLRNKADWMLNSQYFLYKYIFRPHSYYEFFDQKTHVLGDYSEKGIGCIFTDKLCRNYAYLSKQIFSPKTASFI